VVFFKNNKLLIASMTILLVLSACGGGSAGRSSAGGGSQSTPSPQPTPAMPVGFASRPSNDSCFAGESPATPIELQRIFSGVSLLDPLELVQVPGSIDMPFYIAEKSGRILSVPANDDATDDDITVALQLDVYTEGESGIASMAFHPNYADNGLVYVSYIAQLSNGDLELRLSVFDRAEDGIRFENERVLMRIPQAADIHSAGALAFNADGTLYFSVGDDGDNSIGDPKPLRAGDPSNVYGSILRIDVDKPQPPLAYGIPADNPDLTGSGANEVWAYGFRNPWRITFDRDRPDDLWNSNVGLSSWEEINLVTRGGNYGWPTCEGFCDPSNPAIIDPIYTYANTASAAVIGGYVYRGSNIPELFGKYLFVDRPSRKLWALDQTLSPGDPLYVSEQVIATFGVADFSEDNNGEVYVTGFSASASAGQVFRLVRSERAGGGEPPAKLSETGCFSEISNGVATPASGVIEYDIAQRFWSDGASKSRLLAIPNGTSISAFNPNEWVFPLNSVTIKHFNWQDEIFETRFFVRYNDGKYGGYTYEWDEDLNDATLVPKAGKDKNINGLMWHYPSQGECLRCHTDEAGHHLSLESRQLNIDRHYPASDVIANQMDTFMLSGMMRGTAQSKVEPFPSLEALSDGSIPIEHRMLSYLHVNCASCHRSNSLGGRGAWDASFETPFGEKGLCDRRPAEVVNAAGDTDERLVMPGDHNLSTLWQRASLRGSSLAMPPLATNVADDVGNALMAEWIDGLDGACPPDGDVVPARLSLRSYDRFFELTPDNLGGASVCDSGDGVDTAQIQDGSCIVGWSMRGEWLEYDIHAEQAGSFNIIVRMATGVTPEFAMRASVRVDGEEVGSTVVESLGWTNFVDYVIPNVSISEGNHSLRVVFDSGGVNFHYVEVEAN